jgi:uncharacterized membrane protein
MAKSGKALAGVTESLVEKLGEEASKFLEAQVGRLAEKAAGKVTGATGQLTDIVESGGKLPAVSSLMGGGHVKSLVTEKAKSTKDSVVEKTKGALGGGGGSKAGDTKVTSVIETLDVGVPIRTAYDHWTEYESFGDFTKGVQEVSLSDDDETVSDWKFKIAFSNRGYEATVQEQIPDERIEWTSEGEKGTTRGVVTFHEIAPGLTRIILVIEYSPAGFFEKTGNLWRAQGRRMRLDFKNFQRYVSLAGEEPEGWRGEIRDGEVVRTHEEALEAEEEWEDDDEGEEAEGEDDAD